MSGAYKQASDFSTWLDGQPDTASVGHPGWTHRCPLALWLRARGYPEAAVRFDGFSYRRGRNGISATCLLPSWAAKFSRLAYWLYDRPITVAEAREVLRLARRRWNRRRPPVLRSPRADADPGECARWQEAFGASASRSGTTVPRRAQVSA